MKKKSIYKASFEDSLNLLDDSVSGKYTEDLYQDALKKEKYRGTLKSYVWQIILTLIFVIGLNWGFLAVNSYFFYEPDKSEFTFPISKINFFPPWVFWLCLFMWFFLIIIGKGFNKQFILIYRGQFHLLVTYLLWMLVEVNLFFMTLTYESLEFWGMTIFIGSIFLFIYLMLRNRLFSLRQLMYGDNNNDTVKNDFIGKIVKAVMKYGGALVALYMLMKLFMPRFGEFKSEGFIFLQVLGMWYLVTLVIVAFEIYLIFPYMLQGYYKWKYPEEYRDWEGKSVEEWYGKKYLKKCKDKFK